MISGQTITLQTLGETTVNPIGEEQSTLNTTQVDNVLIVTPTTGDATDNQRPYGDTVNAVMYMPRTWDPVSLRGAKVTTQDGRVFTVLGDPMPVKAGITPTRWIPMQINLHQEEG